MAIRITGGAARGRQLRVPSGPVRPTQDRVRAAIFSMLSGRLERACVLDLYAGTGALGLEAWSRGASLVAWVERDRRIYDNLRGNVESIIGRAPAWSLPQLTSPAGAVCVCDDVLHFLDSRPGRRGAMMFDLVLADPPYDRSGANIKKILPALAQGDILESDAWLVLEQARGLEPVASPDWNLVRDRCYGETRICMYRRAGAGE